MAECTNGYLHHNIPTFCKSVLHIGSLTSQMVIFVDPVTVQPMQQKDIDSVVRIERASYPISWHDYAYQTELNNRSAVYIVAKLGDEVIGYAGMWIIMDEAHITTIAVDPNYRGKKVGQRLLGRLLEEAIHIGASRTTLEVRESNVAAQNLYIKYGFKGVSCLQQYYSDNQENAVVMWAENLRSLEYQSTIDNLNLQVRMGVHEYFRD